MANEIRFEQLDGANALPDGDLVAVVTTNGVCAGDRIQIGIQLGDNVTWWKGVALSATELASRQDNHDDNFTEITMATFQAGLLHLWKAKLFGIHTDMYIITNALLHMTGGNRYIFLWVRD